MKHMSNNGNPQSTDTKNKKITGLQVRHEPDPNVNREEYNMDKEFVNLIVNEPFLGAVSIGIPKRPDWKCDTAYIGVNAETMQIVIGYNPDFMRQMKSHERSGLFKHELYHAIFRHIIERSAAKVEKQPMWNVACDLAINSLIGQNNLPDCGLFPGVAPKNCDDPELSKLIASFPKNEAADWYMEKLEEFQEKQQKKGDGSYTIQIGADGQTMDGHDNWDQIPEEIKDIISEQIQASIENGVRNVRQTRQWGSVPESMQQMIEKLLKKEIDWKAVLRLFVGRIRSMERESSLKRYNKKNEAIGEWAFPGCKRQMTAKLLFCIDQSGSMSNENVQMGLNEGLNCSLEGEIDIVNFDTSIDESSFRTVRKGQGFKWERTRCGGTDFDCVRHFVGKHPGRWQGVVIVTDGYAATMGATPNTKILWLITPDGTMEAVRERDLVIQMKVDKKIKKK